MKIIISLKRDYFPNQDNADTMSVLFGLKHEYNQECKYYLFIGQDQDDELYVIEALPYGKWIFEDYREVLVRRQLHLSQEECYFIFHDKDIRDEKARGDDHYSTPFSKHQYKGHCYWLFQHVPGDDIYDILTRKALDIPTLFFEIKKLLNI